MTDSAARLDDCWNRIGVRGNHSCPQLERHVHCRNCPVYSQGGRQMLGRAPPAGYLSDATAHYAAEPAREAAGGRRPVLVFRVSSEWLALPCTLVEEIAESRPQHPLPHRRSGVLLGIVNVRGELLICVSIALVLGAHAAERREPGRGGLARLLVLKRGQQRLACPVDEVHGVRRFDPHALQALPATVTRASARYRKGILPWREQSIGLLDEELLFYTLGRSLA